MLVGPLSVTDSHLILNPFPAPRTIHEPGRIPSTTCGSSSPNNGSTLVVLQTSDGVEMMVCSVGATGKQRKCQSEAWLGTKLVYSPTRSQTLSSSVRSTCTHWPLLCHWPL